MTAVQAKIDKINDRIVNLTAMRADGEISREEYQAMKSSMSRKLEELKKVIRSKDGVKSSSKEQNLEKISSVLNNLIDFSKGAISHDVIKQFVYRITPTSATSFDWYLNLNGEADTKATFTVEGRKKSNIIKLEEIEKISSIHRIAGESNAQFIKNPIVFSSLHRLLLSRSRQKILRIRISL